MIPHSSRGGRKWGRGRGPATKESEKATTTMLKISGDSTAPCRLFLNSGSCTYGARCKFSHDASSSAPRAGRSTTSGGSAPKTPLPGTKIGPCHFFRDKGRCGFGDACKYSHDLTAASSQASGLNSGSNDKKTEDNYRAWRKILGRKYPDMAEIPPLLPDPLEEFLKGGLQLLETGSSDTKQNVVKELGSEVGLARIKQVVESNFVMGYSLRQLAFHRHCVPFLKLVSHKEISDSLVLEKAAGTIYNFIYGPDGSRGVAFFEKVAKNLKRASADEVGEVENVGEVLCAAAATLYQTLSLNPAAIVQGEFKEILNLLCTCYSPDNLSDYTARLAHNDLTKCKERLNMGDKIPLASRVLDQKEPVQISRFMRNIDYPGELSPEGRRHDNDFAEIKDIKILPTQGEIQSYRNEFLPFTDPTAAHHQSGIYRTLDTHFRLLREDTSGQLRDAVRVLQDNWESLVQTEKKKGGREQKNVTKMIVYKDVATEKLVFDRKEGLQFEISFEQPRRVGRLAKLSERADFWKKAKQLQNGSLLALVDRAQNTTFLIVSDRTVLYQPKMTKPRPGDDNHTPAPIPHPGRLKDLASDPERALITLSLADPQSKVDQARILKIFRDRTPDLLNSALVEFPGLLFASFATVLRGLQQLHQNPNIPFTPWISGSSDTPVQSGVVQVPCPLYMMNGNVNLDLSGITNAKTHFNFSVRNPPSVEALKQATTLDSGQCEAFIAAMTRELCLIQGPPGTGKSYLGVKITKALLDNRDKLKLGPIICVCYTNHALDQFLELLLDIGATNLVRLGSRSESKVLEQCQLRNITDRAERTKGEKHEIWSCNSGLDEVMEEMTTFCGRINKLGTWTAIKDYLLHHNLPHHEQLFQEMDADGFTRKLQPMPKIIDSWLAGYSPGIGRRAVHRWDSNRDLDTLQTVQLYSMSIPERLKMKAFWDQEIMEINQEKIQQGIEEHKGIRDNLEKQYTEVKRRCLQDSHVIGVTTTGLATQADLLRSLDAKVLICEEAGEILEAHQLTSFVPKLEHAILIGDHQQLRPHISDYDLSLESNAGRHYALDKSFFERMVTDNWPGGAKFPIATLDTQRRMHPSISELVRKGVPYPMLKDYESTSMYPMVPGMARRLFWFDHRQLENAADKEETIQGSKVNVFEVNFVLNLVRHLTRQGIYKAKDIAVITPYLGQLRELRKKLGSMFDVVMAEKDEEELELEDQIADVSENALPSPEPVFKLPAKPTNLTDIEKAKLLDQVKIATVDNFQGEEAKVIIVSLVRSNEEGKCGFLKTVNRVNVLLSRAQHGMYIIGNAQTATAKVKVWQDVVNMLEREKNIGNELELRCPRHAFMPIKVSKPDDFLRFSPEGGCDQQCALRLNCGHTCKSKCHATYLHNNFRCMEVCPKAFGHCQHACPRRCWEPCGICPQPVFNVPLPCGHIRSRLQCGELQTLDKVLCRTKVTRIMPGCGHELSLECHIDMTNYKCTKVCGDLLTCGHSCRRLCRECKKIEGGTGKLEVAHKKCITPCGRGYTTCGHSCRKPCHGVDACPTCELPCPVRCSHSTCGKKCNEACAPCAEECSWTCVHRVAEGKKCSMPCAVPCDILPCSKRCPNLLQCGHQCPSVCGERCPTKAYCQVSGCGDDRIRATEAIDFIDMSAKYADVNLDDDPIVLLSCRHFFTMSSLDGIMDMNSVYEFDKRTGSISNPKPLSGISKASKPKGCPNCRAPLRDIYRYNRPIKKALLDEATRKFCVQAQEGYRKYAKEVEYFEAQLIQAVTAIKTIFGIEAERLGSTRGIDDMKLFESKIQGVFVKMPQVQEYVSSVDALSQPFGRVHDMVLAARSRGIPSSFSNDDSTLEMGFHIRGGILHLKLQWAMLYFLHSLHFHSVITRDPKVEERLVTRIRKWCSTAQDSALALRLEAETHNFLKQELEARIYWARLVGLELLHLEPDSLSLSATTELRALATQELEDVKALAGRKLSHAWTTLEPEYQISSEMVLWKKIYRKVTDEERKMLAKAMQEEFKGTGHWYTCVNGHAFTIGECGMPMEEARCYECGERIGGRDHTLVEGVRRDSGFEGIIRGVRNMFV